MAESPKFSVSEFIEVCNGSLEYAFSNVMVEGEVSSFKVNQGKWVFFDLKDDEGGTLNCFMALWQMKMPLEDGMKVIVRGTPKVTKWGRFSLTVQQVMPVGEGSIKKSFELLKKKLAAEGLFDESKKRGLPEDLRTVGVISSTQAAGYADFIKIANARWGGMRFLVAHTQVQGMDAPEQIRRALKYFNERGEVQVIAILRGGGSADDLSCFNDEELVREIARSKIPVITGIGHEVDTSLADLAADVRASTPSNAAEMLTKDKKAEKQKINGCVQSISRMLRQRLELTEVELNTKIVQVKNEIGKAVERASAELVSARKLLENLNPERVLARGYAIMRGEAKVGAEIMIETKENLIKAEVKNVGKKEY